MEGTYKFWCWKDKLHGVLAMLALLSGYGYTRDDEAVVLESLRATDNGAVVWFSYNLSRSISLHVDMAYDHEDRNIIFLSIKAPAGFTDRIQLIDAIQNTLKRIEAE